MRTIYKVIGIWLIAKVVLTGAGFIGYHIGYQRGYDWGYKKASEQYKETIIEKSKTTGELRQENHYLGTSILEEQLKKLELMKKNTQLMRDNFDLKEENLRLRELEPIKPKELDIISISPQ